MSNKPEWLVVALGGHPVMLRDGSKAYVRYCEEEYETKYPLLGGSVDADSGEIYAESWAYDGSYIPGQSSSRSDIVGLWQEPTLVFNHWKYLIPNIIAIAKDSDGKWWGYTSVPTNHDNSHWVGSHTPYYGLTALNLEFPECNWQDSLILRYPNQKINPEDS